MLLLAREIDFKAVGPFKDVDGTTVKLFLAMFNSCKTVKTIIDFVIEKFLLNE